MEDNSASRSGQHLSGDPDRELMEVLNRDCHCMTVDEARLRSTLQADLREAGIEGDPLEQRPHLFAPAPVYLSGEQVAQMGRIIGAIESVVVMPAFRECVFGWAPAIAREDHGPLGAFLSYDFHLGPEGPQLIEINTNAGGALLNFYLSSAQRACCAEVEELVTGSVDLPTLEGTLVDMFRREWRQQRGDRELRGLAIIDESPAEQFLHPELLLFERLFERHGLAARVADPRELSVRDGALWLGEFRVDVVYNRLTDFTLETPAASVLRDAYRAGLVVVTPGPRAYALYANKRNLTLLSDPQQLGGLGVAAADIETLARGVPRTILVSEANADELWTERRRLFFKPLAGYGSRGTYRGAKLTRRVWKSIVASDYVAQLMIPPSERHLVVDGDAHTLKIDVRCYVYAGEIQLLGARLYQGQATNLRTRGGGLASVFTSSLQDQR